VGAAQVEIYLSVRRENPNLLFKLLACSPSLLAPVRRRSGPREADHTPSPTVRSHVVFLSSAATTPTAEASSEDTSGTVAAAKLWSGDTVEFGVSRMSSVRVQDMQQLGYFGGGVGRVPGAEEVPEPEGELVVFEAFFIAGLRLPAHRFVSEVLQKFEVQVHQLTPKVVVALAKYV
jgi:hypothetical protein